MKLSFIKFFSILAITLSLSACGGGDGSTGPAGPTGATGPVGPATPAPEPTPIPVKQFITLSNMVNIVVSENVDAAGNNLIDIDNFFIQDDIDGDVFSEDAIDKLVETLLATQNANP